MSSNLLEKAILISTEAHKGQIDKAGDPYIMHLIRVMMKGENEDEKICGILHDIVEDTDWTFQQLEKEGFPKEIIDAIKCVTKIEGESYSEFIERISKNKLAVKVKLNDLEDNMNIKRLKTITDKDIERIEKYKKYYNILKELQ